ncbi:uncharacterized protein LOC115896335 isoform X1 [Rhinopithecus roxellana]|uniref:uncharacterized protein LOC115896335 isoform X1 n=1 Tax=Rhinopithecus roxellana TaxID=61622 RepID=UPI0012373C80|nr:uncharacterized protein LOC115896335 isoform X1 [Rhinopithecus roxellana]
MLQEYLPMFTKKHVQGFHCSNAELSASQFAQFIKKQCGATGTNHEASPGSLTSYPSHLLDRRCQLITLNASLKTTALKKMDTPLTKQKVGFWKLMQGKQKDASGGNNYNRIDAKGSRSLTKDINMCLQKKMLRKSSGVHEF